MMKFTERKRKIQEQADFNADKRDAWMDKNRYFYQDDYEKALDLFKKALN